MLKYTIWVECLALLPSFHKVSEGADFWSWKWAFDAGWTPEQTLELSLKNLRKDRARARRLGKKTGVGCADSGL